MQEEAAISINGKALTVGECMTIRVALENFSMDLSNDGLGEDGHAKEMTKAYQGNIATIRGNLYK